MTDAAIADNNVTQLRVDSAETQKQTLRDCVANALVDYFDNLDGHPGGNLYQMVLQEIEQPLFERVMQQVNGNQSKAAILLGVNRGTLRKKLRMYNLHN